LLKKATHQLGFDLESLRALAIQVELAAAHQAQRRIADRCEVLERIVLDKGAKRRRGMQVEHAAALRR
jgi:prophage DNA circulation protein